MLSFSSPYLCASWPLLILGYWLQIRLVDPTNAKDALPVPSEGNRETGQNDWVPGVLEHPAINRIVVNAASLDMCLIMGIAPESFQGPVSRLLEP